MMGDVGGVEGGSRMVDGIFRKSEDGMVEFFLFESLDFDFRENRRAPRRPSSEGAQCQVPNKKKDKNWWRNHHFYVRKKIT